MQAAPPAIEPGIVLSAVPTDQQGENTGAGAVAGVVVGVALGAAIGGHGAGQVAAAIIGGAAGGVVGSDAERASHPPTGMSYTIEFDDGRVVTIVEHVAPGDPVFAAGAKVAVQTSGHLQHVTAAAP